MSLGENLKKLRLDKKESQTKFAEQLGISRTYLSDLENDRKSPSIDTVNKISQKLNVSPIFLLNNTTLDLFNEFDFKKMTDNEYNLLYDNTFYDELNLSLNELKKRKLSSKDITFLLASFNVVLNQVPDQLFCDLEIISSSIGDYYSKDDRRKSSVVEFTSETLNSLDNLTDFFEHI